MKEAGAVDQLSGVVPDHVKSGQFALWRNHQTSARQKERAKRALISLDTARRTADLHISKAIVSHYIERRMNDPHVPVQIINFLDLHWRVCLIRASINRYENIQHWRESVRTTENLLWSVRPKTNATSRRRFFSLLPQLYQKLYAGLESLGWSPADQDEFFSALAKIHEAALHQKPSSPNSLRP